MLKNYGKCLTILCAGMYTSAVFSAGVPFASLLSSSFVATLSAGPAWGNAGNNQTLTLAPDIDKTYTANRPHTTVGNYDLFLGVQRPLAEKLKGQIGLDVATTGNAVLSGEIWDDASPQFNNYTYQYLIRHSQIGLKGKLLSDFGWPLLPWVSATAGVGFNRSNSFTNTPTIYQAVASPNFSSHTVTAFTYAVGIGVQRPLTTHLQIGIGYEFADWGRGALGSVDGSTTNSSLSLSHFYTQAVMLNVTYLA